MIKTIRLKNFRKHEDLTLDFEPGLVALRGVNEAGKSTITEAFGYAVIGSKALRQPIAQVVTWGKAVNTCAVEVLLSIDSTLYTLTRSKGGAELNFEGGKITGQTEVSLYMERLLGCSVNQAVNLWMASQKNITGALSKGSTETGQMIEELADFEAFDYLVELIKANWATGNAKMLEDRLEQAEQLLSDNDSEVPQITDVERDEVASTKEKLDDLIRKSDLAKLKYEQAVEAAEPVVAAQQQIEEATEHFKGVLDLIKEAQVKVDAELPEKVEQSDIDLVQAQEAANTKLRKELAARVRFFKELDALPFKEDLHWNETSASFKQFRGDALGSQEKAQDAINEAQRALAGLEAQLITESACGLCGKDLADVPEVVVKNTATNKEIVKHQAKLEQALEQAVEAKDNLWACQQIGSMWEQYSRFADKYEDWVRMDDTRVPPVPVPLIDRPAEEIAYPDMSPEIERLQAKMRAYQRALTLKEAAEQEIATRRASIDELEKSLVDLHGIAADPGMLLEAVGNAMEAYSDLSEKVESVGEDCQQMQQELESRERTIAAVASARERAEKLVASSRTDLEDLQFNNTVLKKVRDARPMIVDRLWTVVLGTVSHYFSTMREQESVVSRKDGIFLVDGHPIEGLSGSTIDILGLAIRIALLKTFLPRCDFMILDEPAAAANDDRESALIGAVAAAGFSQTLLITHSTLADSFAEQVVRI